jgi:MFS transporter, FSR family, fosmidomycin resistance protein
VVKRIAWMTAGHAIDDLYQGAVPALIPFLVAERGYSYAAVAGITLAATLLSSVAQPAFGLLTDRRRRPWLVPVGVGLAGVGIGLAGVGEAYLLTWCAVALSGLGIAAYHPEASRSARLAAGDSAWGMSWFALGGSIGFAVAPLVVTPVLAAGGLAATPWLAVPALAMVAVLVVRRRVVEEAPAARAAREAATDDWRAFRWLTAVVVCRSVCFFGLTSFLALYLVREHGFGRAGASVALTVMFVAGAVGTLAGGWLADRYGRLRTIRGGYLLTLPGLGGLLVAPTHALTYVAVAVLGFAIYVPFAVHVTLGHEYLPNHLGTASGVTLGLAVSVGGVVAPLLGWLADAAGITAAFLVLLAVPAVALALSERLRTLRARAARSAPGAEPVPRR